MENTNLSYINTASAEELNALGDEFYDKEKYDKAFELYTKAFEKDPENKDILYNLAFCYRKGFGIEKNDARAQELFRKSADKGHKRAAYWTADYYYVDENPLCVEWWEKATELGDDDAPHFLALSYRDGKFVEQSIDKAVEYYNLAIERGNYLSMLNMGNFYIDGKYVEKNITKGIDLLIKASEENDTFVGRSACYHLSVLYLLGQKVTTDAQLAYDWAIRGAKKGDPRALQIIGSRYANGTAPFERDYQKAFNCFLFCSQCPNVEDPDIFESLGKCYIEGIGTPIDKISAKDSFEKAAKLGSKDSLEILKEIYPNFYGEGWENKYFELVQILAEKDYTFAIYELALCYSQSLGTEENFDEFEKYLDIAFERDYPLAINLTANLYESGTLKEKNLEKAYECYQKGASLGFPLHKYKLAVCYKDGIGVEKNKIKALELFYALPELELPEVLLDLGELFDKNGLAPTDYNKALSYYERAYNLKSNRAAYHLAWFYYNGFGIEQNYEKAFSLALEAYENGDEDAGYLLGGFYKNGIGTVKNPIKALDCYNNLRSSANEELSKNCKKLFDETKNLIPPSDYIEYITKKANEGNMYSQFDVGMFYLDENNAQIYSESKAYNWLSQAADNGLLTAKYELADLIINSEDCPKDYSKAEKYFLEVIENGTEKQKESAKLGLAVLYDEFLSKSEEAFKLFNELATKYNNSTARTMLANLNKKRYNAEQTSQITENNSKDIPISKPLKVHSIPEKTAIPIKKTTVPIVEKEPIASESKVEQKEASTAEEIIERAKNNDVEAILIIANSYDKGMPGADIEKRLLWLKKAADLGSSDAMLMICSHYTFGEDEVQNPEECFELATKAFENGDEPKRACFALGYLYLKGIGTDVNPMKALEFLSVPLSICDDNQGIASLYYDEAKDMIDIQTFVNWLKSTCNRFPYSQYRLGEMYENGEYFVTDRELAEACYSKSAAGGCVDGIMSLAILLKDSGIQSKELRAEKLFKDIIASEYRYEHRRAKRCLASLYQNTNKLTEALNICDEILAEDPQDAVVYNIKGSVYLEKKDYRQARQWYEKSYCISNDPKCKDLIDSIDEVIRTGADKQTSSGGGCYVATAIYGSYDCPQVWTLRRFRDNTLDATWYGKLFIWLYYSISPTIVKHFGDTKLFKAIFKNKLDKFVRNLNEKGVENTPYTDKIF